MLAVPQLEDCQGESEVTCETDQRTPDLPLRVIAGNHDQAEAWANREGIRQDCWRYVVDGSDEALRGVRNVRVVWIGTFWNRRDFDKIATLVDELVSKGAVVVDRNEVRNNGRKARKKTES